MRSRRGTIALAPPRRHQDQQGRTSCVPSIDKTSVCLFRAAGGTSSSPKRRMSQHVSCDTPPLHDPRWWHPPSPPVPLPPHCFTLPHTEQRVKHHSLPLPGLVARDYSANPRAPLPPLNCAFPAHFAQHCTSCTVVSFLTKFQLGGPQGPPRKVDRLAVRKSDRILA